MTKLVHIDEKEFMMRFFSEFSKLVFRTGFLIIFMANLAASQAFADGQFTFTIKRDGIKEDEALADYIEKKGTFKKIVKALNDTLIIPYDIRIVLTNSKYGPHYDPNEKMIVLDYGDERWSAAQYDQYYPDSDKETRQYYLNNINLFSLYHELGHALIDAYHIPMLGSEEDAADDLASVMILYYFKKGPNILLDNADYFDAARLANDSEENEYWDVHALNAQRYYRLLCYAYAKAPKFVSEQLKELDDDEGTLAAFIDQKKDTCVDDYKRLNQSWFTVLSKHFTKKAEAEQAIDKVNQSDPAAEESIDEEDEDEDE